MDFARIIYLARWEVILFVFGLAAIVAIKMLTGGINTRYLLYGMRRDGTRYFSPERVQMLVAQRFSNADRPRIEQALAVIGRYFPS